MNQQLQNAQANPIGQEAQTSITRTEVPGNSRMGFLPKYFSKDLRLMMSGEALVFNWCRELCAEYSGGFWKYYELSNGGFYMALDDNERVQIEAAGNQFTGEVSADALGIISTLYALNQMTSQFHSHHHADQLVDHYYQLRDYAKQHPEADVIFAAID